MDIPGRIEIQFHNREVGGKITYVSLTFSRRQLLDILVMPPGPNDLITLGIQSEEHIPLILKDPPGLLKPYVWRATVRTPGEPDEVVVAGDGLPDKGVAKKDWVKILKPKEIPQGRLKRLDLLPANPGSKWPRIWTDFGPPENGETLFYSTTIDEQVVVEEGVSTPYFRGATSVRLGRVLPDGTKVCVVHAHMDGSHEVIQ